MKKRLLILLVGLLCLTLLCGCVQRENPTTPHIVYRGELWEINTEETSACVLEEENLIDAILIDPDVMPSEEGECNARAGTAQIYVFPDGSGQFMVILDGEQYFCYDR